MQISVVVPTYRRPDLLKLCLKALMRQNFNADLYEIIVVSDGPDLATQAVTKKSDPTGRRVRFLALDEQRGPAAARNAGWLTAKGTIVAFTDDDCLPDKSWIKSISCKMQAGNVVAAGGRVIVPRSKKPTDYEQNTAGLETAAFVTANCACIKSALISTGGFDERFRMAWREDSDLHFKLLGEQIPVAYLPDAIVVHPVRAAPWGVSLKEQKKTLFNALLYQKHPDLYRKLIQPSPPYLYYTIVLAFLFSLSGLVIGSYQLAVFGSAVWMVLYSLFLIKRLRGTRLTTTHITEMMVTSLLIPFLSLYWQWYGSVKYRVFLV